MTLRHWLAHRFHWQHCRHEFHNIDGQEWCFVYCATCGQLAFFFEVSTRQVGRVQ